jgi:hypothetical protein
VQPDQLQRVLALERVRRADLVQQRLERLAGERQGLAAGVALPGTAARARRRQQPEQGAGGDVEDFFQRVDRRERALPFRLALAGLPITEGGDADDDAAGAQPRLDPVEGEPAGRDGRAQVGGERGALTLLTARRAARHCRPAP